MSKSGRKRFFPRFLLFLVIVGILIALYSYFKPFEFPFNLPEISNSLKNLFTTPEETTEEPTPPTLGQIPDAPPFGGHTHSFGEWVIVKEPTTTEEGLKERTCACGEKETKTIAIELPRSVGLEYMLNEDGESYSVTGIGTCTDTDIVIPDVYEGLPVTAIKNTAFYGYDALTSITIPDSVATIGDYNAFAECSNLTSIVFDGNNTAYQSINGNLYSKDGTVLIAYAIGKTDTNFVIPSSVTTIGRSAFNSCTNLTSVTIGDSVTTIGFMAFRWCTNLTSVTISNSVTSIGESTFEFCSNLTSITFEGTVEQWNAIEKDRWWDYDTATYTIYCTNGEIAKDGTVTLN